MVKEHAEVIPVLPTDNSKPVPDSVSPKTPLRPTVESLFNVNTIDNHLQHLQKTPVTPQAVIKNHLMRSEDRIDKLEISILEIVEAQSKQYEAWSDLLNQQSKIF